MTRPAAIAAAILIAGILALLGIIVMQAEANHAELLNTLKTK